MIRTTAGLPIVSFEERPVEDRAALMETGKGVRYAEFAIFRYPGDKNSILEKEITEEEKRSWMEQPHKNHVLPQYEAWKSGLEAPVDGTPLRDWAGLTPSQLHQAITIGLRTVEDFAALSDEGLRAYGTGALTLKQRAKNYLETTHGTKAAVQMQAMEMEMKAMKEKMERLEMEKSALAAQQEKLPEVKAEAKPETKPKK